MIKRSILIALSLCMIFAFSCFAENSDENMPPVPPVSGENPFPGGEVRADGIPPRRDFGGEGQPPMTWPQQSATTSSETETVNTNTNIPPTENSTENSPTENRQENFPEFDRNMQGAPMMPGGMNGRNPISNNTQNTEIEQVGGIKGFLKTYQTPVISVIILILAFIFVKFYKRKQY